MKKPSNPREQIEPERLIQTTDAVVEALRMLQDAGEQTIFPPDLVGKANCPACLIGYSKFEVEEATAFLARLGVVEML